MRNDHADRTRPRARLREDRFRLAPNRHRNIVATARANASHAHHDRQLALLRQPTKLMIDIIAARNGSARRADSQYHAHYVRVVAHPLNLPRGEAVLPLHDGATYINDR